MKVSYSLTGVPDLCTDTEASGITISHVTIKDGRLCIYFDTDIPLVLKVVELNPRHDAINLIIKEYHQPKEKEDDAHVVYHIIKCVPTPVLGDCFICRKYEADVPYPFYDYIGCNVTEEALVRRDFVCTKALDSFHGDVIFYEKN